MTQKIEIQKRIRLLGHHDITVAAISKRLKAGNYQIPNDVDWEIIDDICDGIRTNRWEALTDSQKIDQFFEIIELWPTYTATSRLFEFFRDSIGLEQKAAFKLWAKILALLGSKNQALREAMEYVLWVDFFEDQSTCEPAWNGLMNANPDKPILERILVNAGPVPYALKKKIYDHFIKNPNNHAVLAESLARSLNDVFGDIDRSDAKRYLGKLVLPKDNRFAKYLKEHL